MKRRSKHILIMRALRLKRLCIHISAHGSVSSRMVFFLASRRKTSKCFCHREQEVFLEYNSKGNHYATVHTPGPRPRNLRLRFWLHDVS